MLDKEIPKVIHYCWFGGSPLGPNEIACIDSWSRMMPDYKIIRWDETNFDISQNTYVLQAYEVGKWAFVSDYARFKILYDKGGIYFDTDVEVLKPIDDLVQLGPFMGCEANGTDTDWADISDGDESITVNSGLGLCTYKSHPIYEKILQSYDNDCFIKEDGSLNQLTVVTRVTNLLRPLGLRNVSNIQTVGDITVYPKDYFNPKDFTTGLIDVTANTRTIHHFGMTWVDEKWQFERRMCWRLASTGLSGDSSVAIAKIITCLRYGDIRRIVKKITKPIARVIHSKRGDC